MYDRSTATRNYLGGVARRAGFSDPAIGRFIDAVREFRLDCHSLIAALAECAVNDVDLFGISRITQLPRLASSDESRPCQAHGRTFTWTVRLYVRSLDKVVGSFADTKCGGTEKALVQALAFRDRHLRSAHQPRGPYHPKRRRPAASSPPERRLSGGAFDI
jgi:hypothetical protein